MVWIVMENKSFREVIGSRNAPFINRLAARCGLATNFTAESHPSLPNYVAMTSGGTQGIHDDAGPSAHRLRVASIFSQLQSGWRTFAESMPSNCSSSNSSRYLVRHNPAVYFTNVLRRCMGQDIPLGSAPDVSARFTFMVPNPCNDTHDCSLRTGDAWLSKWLAKIFATPQYRSNTTAVFLTWDENDGGPGNGVPTIVVSPSTAPGRKSGLRFTHYSMLRTTQELLGLQPLLGHARSAPSMRAAFGL
ncbi:MAG: alkaline phosphatase family protein [Thermoleophilaceae bacterium]